MLDYNGKLISVMSRVGDIMLMNLLLTICCLPVFTIGAAITAVYDMSLRLIRRDDIPMIRGFFRSFRSNFRKSTALWGICALLLMICFGDLLVRRFLPQLRTLLTAAAMVQGVLLLSVMLYAFPLQARFENTLTQTLKNAVFLALCSLPQTILMLLTTLIFPMIMLYVPIPEKLFPCVLTLYLLLGGSLVIYLNSLSISRIFERFFKSEGLDRDKED